MKSDGSVVAVGRNEDGQCNVENWTDIMQVSAGGGHTVGLKSDGSVVAVGYNDWSQCNLFDWNLIKGVTPTKQPPVASFTYSPESPCVGDEITFDASASNDPDGEIVSYEWDFGDGSTEEGKVVTHSYSSEGEYKVTLTVKDDGGKTGTSSKQITVVKEAHFPCQATNCRME